MAAVSACPLPTAWTHLKNNLKQLEVFLFAINVALLLMCWAPRLTVVSYSVSHGNGQKDRGQETKFK